jgi:hypothetical protein
MEASMITRVLTLAGTVFFTLCFCLLFVVLFVNATEVQCGLGANQAYTCQTRTLLLGRWQTRSHTIEDVVDLIMVNDSCQDGCAYRAEFVTASGGQVPVSIVYTDENRVSRQVDTLRTQMARQAGSIVYRAEPQWWALFLIVGISGMVILLSPLTLLRRR